MTPEYCLSPTCSELTALRTRVAKIQAALGNGADEHLWPPGTDWADAAAAAITRSVEYSDTLRDISSQVGMGGYSAGEGPVDPEDYKARISEGIDCLTQPWVLRVERVRKLIANPETYGIPPAVVAYLREAIS